MTDKTHSDVDRALAAFGSGTIKYRSFGAPALRPTPLRVVPVTDPAEETVLRPAALDDADPFSAPMSVHPPQAAENSASRLFPLLGAAVPEAGAVQVHEGRGAGAEHVPGTEYRPTGYEVPAGSFSPAASPAAPPSAYAPVPAELYPNDYAPAATRHAPPPDTRYQSPASYQTATYAPAPQPAPASGPSQGPLDWALDPPPASPTPRPSRDAPARAAPAPSDAPPPITSLAAHFPEPGVGPSGATMEAADRRSLAEMFRVLADRADSQVARSSVLAGVRAEEPGLFRRL